MSVLLNTSLGDMVIDLHTEKCPLTAKNFLKLCKIKYYNNCVFHMVQKDFIVQTGDPTGTGTGGDSIYKFLYGDQARFFSDEIHPDLKHDTLGVVAMASAGENLNASQFYITTRADLDYLDGKHTIFGVVAEGEEVLMRINEAYVDEKFRPFKNIRIKHTCILDDPFEDPVQLADLIPDSSPVLKPPAEGEEVRLEDDWVPMDEQLNAEELERSLRQKEAHSRAVVLEMVGDIPEAEIKPPENVLFVCKLNPVTQEEDLEVIFSRFGKVVSADIIRDYKTGDSLCYAFIDFETQEACESAYFKMDNVLIDDRRIHVDFSQSVSQLWTRYRRFGKRDRDDGGGVSHIPNAKGRGCFKCGEMGHVARDCTNDGKNGEAIQEKPKYELKDRSGQHGGTGKKYDMVFEHASPEGKKHYAEEVKSDSSHRSRKNVEPSHRMEHSQRDREGKHMSHEKSREYKGRSDEKQSDVDGRRPHDVEGKRDERHSRHGRETSPDYRHRDRHGRIDDHRSVTDYNRSDRHSDRDRDKDRDRDNRYSRWVTERQHGRRSRHENSPERRHSRKEKGSIKDEEYKRRRTDESE